MVTLRLPHQVLVDEYLRPHNIWVITLASGCGFTRKETIRLVTGEIPISPRIATELGRVLMTTTPEYWLDLQHQTDRAVIGGAVLPPSEPPPDDLMEEALYGEEHVANAEVDVCKGLIKDGRRVSWWLSNHQVFTLNAFMKAFGLTPRVDDKLAQKILRPKGYHSLVERHDRRQRWVWRFNPARFPRRPL